MTQILFAILAIIIVNIITIALFWIDKRAAINRASRISEKTLLVFCLIGGTPGAFFAQQRFRHKTQKEPFRTLMILIAVLQVLLIGLALIKPELVHEFIGEMRL